ncbi:molybdopterin cofactor-binding domain-containing protein [Mesorhizobium opportunistum]|uniref:molybdopterin cofactor-binding domain-containing protein n=1 Tax=Mesorhizobium opportunistum TaxID=593909 RepID=UPI003DA10023
MKWFLRAIRLEQTSDGPAVDARRRRFIRGVGRRNWDLCGRDNPGGRPSEGHGRWRHLYRCRRPRNGQGIRTALAAAVASRLDVPAENVTTIIDDTGITPQHLTAGSWGTASAIPAAEDAADAMVKALSDLGTSGRTPAESSRLLGVLPCRCKSRRRRLVSRMACSTD